MSNQSVPSPQDKPKRSWQEVAEELSQEYDTQKVIDLSHELNDVMIEDEKRKAQKHLKTRA
jgi:hypothetical protein